MQNKNVKLIYIEWCDAITYTDGWIDRESVIEWAKNDDWIIRQAGFLIEENEKYIILAAKYNPQIETNDKYSELTKIPKTWVKRKKIISSF